MNLADRLVALHDALDAAEIEHAFGGAIALAYWVEEPRGTRDIDINVFVDPSECGQALSALPAGIGFDDSTVERIERDGQTRLLWEDTFVDLFFSNLPIHHQAERHRRHVPFEGREIPILGPLELGIFKAMFDRGRDWGDIEEMLASQTLDADALRDQLTELLGPDDQRLARLADVLRRLADPSRGTPRMSSD